MDKMEKTKAISLDDCIKGFIFHCQYEKNLNEKTINAYTIDLEQFQSYMKTQNLSLEIDSVSKDLIKNYLQSIYGFKPKTVKRKIASLKAMFNWLEYENDDFINPFGKIKIRFKEPQILPTVMTINEVKKILDVMYGELNSNTKTNAYTCKAQVRNIAIVELLFATGIRVSELCNLKTVDMDMKSGTVKVFGKGSKERIIQICDLGIKTALRKYRKLYNISIKEDGYFFINRLGHPVSTQSVRLMIHRYVQKAGITKHVTPHTFRHTFATLLLEESVDIRYIQNMLGHSAITTTQVYTHINTETQKKILATKHPRRKLEFTLNE
jgi:integrase/recombinase XerD